MTEDGRHNEQQRESIKKRRNEAQRKFLDALEETSNVQIACRRAGIVRATVYRWLKFDAEFIKQFDLMKAHGREVVNDLAHSKLLQKLNEGYWPAIRHQLLYGHPDYLQKSSYEREQLQAEAKYKAYKEVMDFLHERNHPAFESDDFIKAIRDRALRGILGLDDDDEEEAEKFEKYPEGPNPAGPQNPPNQSDAEGKTPNAANG